MDNKQDEKCRLPNTFFLNNYSYQTAPFIAAAIAEALSVGLNDDELNALSNFILTIGQNMAFILAQRALQNSLAQSDTEKEITLIVNDQKFVIKATQPKNQPENDDPKRFPDKGRLVKNDFQGCGSEK